MQKRLTDRGPVRGGDFWEPVTQCIRWGFDFISNEERGRICSLLNIRT